MVISDDPRFIFVHIPKTAGLSVSVALEPEGSRTHKLCVKKGKHETLSSLRRRVGEGRLDGYRSFAIVRHPLDRLVSHFSYLKQREDRFTPIQGVPDLETYIELLQQPSSALYKPERVWPQNAWTHSEGKHLVDRVFRFEDLPGCFGEVCDFIGLTPRTLPQENVTPSNTIIVSGAVRAFVRDAYLADYELFGYES